MKFGTLAYTDILGLPLLAWGGLTTLGFLLATAAISTLNMRGIRVVPMKYHRPMAYLTIVFALAHGLLGMLATLGL